MGSPYNAGLAARLTPSTLLGLSSRHSAPPNFSGTFSIDMNNDFFTRDLARGAALLPAG
jgi:hypothetical protein